MSKRNILTDTSGPHGDQKHPLHGIHQEQADKRRQKRKTTVFVCHEVAEEKDYPPFRSDISKLGGGQNFVVVRKEGKFEIQKMNGDKWLEKLLEAKLEYSWYHQRQDRNGKVGWFRRKVKDREKLGKTDKHGRKPTDVMRETIDLRPDHSRFIQYLLETGRKEEAVNVLTEVRIKKIEVFENIYPGRWIPFAGEHDDAGQHHDDLWHCGISEHPSEKIGKKGETPRRERVPFRAFGVGVGACSWWRHFEVLKESGITGDEINKLAKVTVEALEADKTKAREQNDEDPRDLRLLAEIDTYVAEKLSALDAGLYSKARSEYKDWIRVGYETGKLGVIQGSALQKLSEKLKSVEKELEELRRLKDLVKQFVEDVMNSKLLARLHKVVGKLLTQIATAVGITMNVPVKDEKESLSGPEI